MAYGTEYYHEFRNKENILQRIEILKDGFTDSETLIKQSTGDPVVSNHIGEKNVIPIIQGSELVFRFYSFERDEYDDLMTAVYKDRKIKYWDGSTLVFEGYLKPENIVTEKMSDAYIVELTATDALADLRQVDFKDNDDDSTINGKYSGLEILKYALEHIGINLDFKIQLGTYESTYMAASELALDKIEVNSLRFIKQGGEKTETMSCHQVIETILGKYNCVLCQEGGYYKIANKHELNSYEFLFAWSDLSQTSRTATDNIKNITDYKFEKVVEQQKIQPLNKVGIKFRNKDLGGDVTNADLTDWNGVWTIDFYNDNVTDDVVTLTSKSSEHPETNDNSITLNTAFAVSRVTGTEYLKVSFDHILSSYLGADTPHVSMKIEVTRPDTSVVTSYEQCNETWTSYESRIIDAFKIVETGNYNVKITFIPNPAFSWTWDSVSPIIFFKVKDVKISEIYNIEEGVSDYSNVSFDEYYEQTTGVGIELLPKEFLLADGGQVNEVGSLLYNDSGTYKITADWRTYGNTEDIKLIDIYARNVLNDRYAFKDYLRLTIFDASDITLSNIYSSMMTIIFLLNLPKIIKRILLAGRWFNY